MSLDRESLDVDSLNIVNIEELPQEVVSRLRQWLPRERYGVPAPGYCSIVIGKDGGYIAKEKGTNFVVGDFVDLYYDRQNHLIAVKPKGATRKISDASRLSAHINCRAFLKLLNVKRGLYPCKWHDKAKLWIIKYQELGDETIQVHTEG